MLNSVSTFTVPELCYTFSIRCDDDVWERSDFGFSFFFFLLAESRPMRSQLCFAHINHKCCATNNPTRFTRREHM